MINFCVKQDAVGNFSYASASFRERYPLLVESITQDVADESRVDIVDEARDRAFVRHANISAQVFVHTLTILPTRSDEHSI